MTYRPRNSVLFALCLLSSAISMTAYAQEVEFCSDVFAESDAPTIACCDAVYLADGVPGQVLVGGNDAGLMNVDFDGFNVFPSDPPPNNLSNFSSNTDLLYFGGPGRLSGESWESQSRFNLEMGTRDSSVQIAGIGCTSQTTFFPTFIDGSTGPVPIDLAVKYEFTLKDGENATPGDVSAGFFVEVVDESGNEVVMVEGRCVLNLDVNPEPVCETSPPDVEVKFSDRSPIGFIVEAIFGEGFITIESGPLTVKAGSSAEIFTDGFELGDTETWGAYSNNTFTLSVSSPNPNVRFTTVTEPSINAGMNDAWVSADAPFQGFFFTVFPDLELFFLSWFTFDSVPPGAGVSAVFGAADQRWVTGAGSYSGNSAAVSVELTSGGVFNGSDPSATQQPGYGSITIEFINCNMAVLTYDFPTTGLSGEMTVTRVITDNVALCQALAAQ